MGKGWKCRKGNHGMGEVVEGGRGWGRGGTSVMRTL